MDTILTTSVYEGDEIYYLDKATMWLVDDDSFYPSTNLKIKAKLDPGVYQISFDRNRGTFCQKIDINSDALYTFSDSSINSLLSEIATFWDNKKIYEEHNLVHKRGVLLEGPPGNGKTSLISLLSKQIIDKGGLVFMIDDVQKLSLYVNFITIDFRSIQPDTPIITVLEDLDKFSDSPYVLDFFDGKNSLNNHVIISTTNNTGMIPDTLLRPSRIDLRVVLDNPSEHTIREYFVFKKVPEEDLDKLIEISKDLSLADLKELYITIYVLGYTKEQSIEKIRKSPQKKNYIKNNFTSVKGL